MGCSRKGEEEEERKKKREREREREKRGMIFSIFDLDLEGLKKS
jgi:ribosomal protein L12E/L44/L45/RPP1/RPP2